jgi:two-component system nitrate/nitrite response regulator NarL
MNLLTLALMDNHPATIVGLTHVFASQGGFDVVASGRTARDALAIAAEHRPALMVLDPAAPGDVIAAIAEITARYPDVRILAFTAAPGVDCAVGVLEAGARGYVSKSCSVDELVNAVRAVAAGETYISQNFATGVITALRNASVRRIAMQALKLTAREDQIVNHLMSGKSNKEIASRLGITERTVKHYMSVLMQKLNARNRVEAVIAAQRLRHLAEPGSLPIHRAPQSILPFGQPPRLAEGTRSTVRPGSGRRRGAA